MRLARAYFYAWPWGIAAAGIAAQWAFPADGWVLRGTVIVMFVVYAMVDTSGRDQAYRRGWLEALVVNDIPARWAPPLWAVDDAIRRERRAAAHQEQDPLSKEDE